MPPRLRLDKLLVDLGLAPSRDRAQSLIMAGHVLVNDRPASKPGAATSPDAVIRLKKEDFPWVSRGALKLLHALEHWPIEVADRLCMDVGASTGGFTDVLLHHGAAHVYAVDVGYGQLAWKLRDDPRVTVLERTNVRNLTEREIPEPVDILTMDVSFISLTKALPPALPFLKPGGVGVVLIKPQFEAGRGQIGKGGVVRDLEVRRACVETITQAAPAMGLDPLGSIPSPILGPKGNEEFLFHFRKST